MKIELKRKNGKQYEYIDIRDISGIPMIDIIVREAMRPESCMKITTERGVTIATDDPIHNTHYLGRGYKLMSWKDALLLLDKHYGDKLLTVIPEEVHELWPGAVYVGCSDEQREAS